MKSRSKKNIDLFNKLLNNKIVLYVVALIALIDVIAYIINKEFGAVLFFYLVGLIAYKFSNNMTFVLGSALIATSLVHLLKNIFGFKEGFQKSDNEKFKKQENFKENKKNKEKNMKEDLEEDMEEDMEEDLEEDLEEDMEEDTKLDMNDIIENEEMKNKLNQKNDNFTPNKEKNKPKKKVAFTNQLKKPSLNPKIINNIPNKDKLTQNMSKADNIEAAYDNLEKTIGENGIKSMSGATKDLIAQQNQLVKGLKEVTPVLNEAMGALSKIDLTSLSGMFNKFSSQV